MNLDFMHIVDYWIGIPLCFVVSVFDRVRVMLAPPSSAPPKRMLLIELSEMGSAVLAYPAIQEAVAKLGAENVWFMIFERNRAGISVLGLIPDAQILTVSDRSFTAFVRTLISALLKCRSERIDTAVDLEIFSRCTALLTYLCGARIRTGLSAFENEGLYRGSLFTHPILYSAHHHMARVYMTLVRAAFAPRPHGEPLFKDAVDTGHVALPRLNATPAVAEAVDRMLADVPPASRLVLFNPDAGLLPLRAWPDEHFTRLGRLLLDADPRVAIAVVGVERAGPLAERIRASLPLDRCLNFTGRTRSLEELVELMNRSATLVTIDSGPAHFSGLSGIARVVLFGPETPALYGPIGDRVQVGYADLSCSPCFSAANHRTSSCTDNQCLKRITPEQVCAQVLATL